MKPESDAQRLIYHPNPVDCLELMIDSFLMTSFDDPVFKFDYDYDDIEDDTDDDFDDDFDELSETDEYIPNPISYNDYYLRGVDKSDIGDFVEAIFEYDEADRLESGHTELYFLRGDSKFCIEDFEGAIADFTKVIAIDGEYERAYYSRAIARKYANQFHEAIDDFTKAIVLEPTFAHAYFDRGTLKSLLGDIKGMIDDYKMAYYLYPGFGLSELKKLEHLSGIIVDDEFEAIEVYDKLIASIPPNALAYLCRSLAKLESGDNYGSLADFQIAKGIKPNLEDRYYVVNMAIYNSKRQQKEIAEFEKSIFFYPEQAKKSLWWLLSGLKAVRNTTLHSVFDIINQN